MVLWPENNFQSDAGQTLSEQGHNQIFFPTTIMEPNNFQQATGEELQEIIDNMTLNENVTINDYIFWSSTNDGMFNDVRRVTLGTLLDMLEIEAVAPTALQIASIINLATAKTSLVDADRIGITDSADTYTLKKITWANLKASIQAYTDTLYNNYVHPDHTGDITSDSDGATTLSATAISGKTAKTTAAGTEEVLINDAGVLKKMTIQNLIALAIGGGTETATTLGSLINGATEKTIPVDADMFALMDSEDSNIVKKLSWLSLATAIQTYTDALYADISHTHAYGTLTGIPSTFAPSSHTHPQSDITNLTSDLSNKQPLDSDLTAIAALSPANDDFIQRKAGVWTNRTMAQLKTDLSLSNVDNTSDSTKNSATATLTNKRITLRVTSETSSATPTINTDNSDAHSITALAVAITSMTTNLSGTPTNFQKLIIRIKDNGTARAITWGSSFEAKGVALPTTTVISKVLTVGFIYDTVTSKWGCVASAQEA